MAFNVQYSFNNGAVTGTATDILQLRQAIYNYNKSGSVSDTGYYYNDFLTQCTLSGTAEGQLTTGYDSGTKEGTTHGLFESLRGLKSINLSNLNTSNVTNMNYMFDTAYRYDYEPALDEIIGIENLNTSNVTSMVNMFAFSKKLTSLDLSNWDTRNVTNMNGMFLCCDNLTSLDLSNWNTSNVTNMSAMFAHCLSLTELHLENFDTSSASTSLLAGTYVGFRIDDDYTSSRYNASLFSDCNNLEHIYVGEKFDISNTTYSETYGDVLFRGCTKLPNFDSTKIDKSMAKQTWQGGYFEGIVPTAEFHYKYGSNTFPIKLT